MNESTNERTGGGERRRIGNILQISLFVRGKPNRKEKKNKIK